jgi:hypothetical protein
MTRPPFPHCVFVTFRPAKRSPLESRTAVVAARCDPQSLNSRTLICKRLQRAAPELLRSKLHRGSRRFPTCTNSAVDGVPPLFPRDFPLYNAGSVSDAFPALRAQKPEQGQQGDPTAAGQLLRQARSAGDEVEREPLQG